MTMANGYLRLCNLKPTLLFVTCWLLHQEINSKDAKYGSLFIPVHSFSCSISNYDVHTYMLFRSCSWCWLKTCALYFAHDMFFDKTVEIPSAKLWHITISRSLVLVIWLIFYFQNVYIHSWYTFSILDQNLPIDHFVRNE